MVLLAIEGFDDGLAALRYPLGPGAVSATYGKHGKGMLVGDVSADYLLMPYPSWTADTTITAGGWIQVKTDGSPLAGGSFVFGFTAVTTTGISLNYEVAVGRTTADDGWMVRDLTGYTYWGAGTFLKDAWYFVELQYTRHDTTGSWEVQVDGVSVQSATSRDTLRTGIPAFSWGGSNANDADAVWVDDIYILDSTGSFNNDFLGICEVELDLPSGNGNSSVLVGSDGNSTDNYLLVDNNAAVPPATTEYVESDTEGDKDTYAMSDLTTTGVVHGVMTTLYAEKDDTGGKFIRPVIRSGGTDYPSSASKALTDSVFAPFDWCWDFDPDTSTTWLYGGVNSMEVGPEVRDS